MHKTLYNIARGGKCPLPMPAGAHAYRLTCHWADIFRLVNVFYV